MPPQAGMNLEVHNDQTLRDVSQASAGPSVGVQVVLFSFFVLTRAIHPVIIDMTKVTVEGKDVFLYSNMSVPLVETVFTLVIGQLMALANGGLREWKDIWKPAPMKVFSVIGFIYALGDYLEMASMGSLSGATYQVLLQSKLLITALMMWGIKGTKQNALQWNILALVMVSMCVYMITVSSSSKEGDEQSGGVHWYAYVQVLLKVTVSCLCAVLSDKYMKDFKNEPIYMQLVQFKVAWFATLLAITFFDGVTWQNDFFNAWNSKVVGAAVSFTVKGWSTMYLLAILDSVLKNIGEASAILVTYFMKSFLPSFPDDHFRNDTFLCVMVVILSVTAYVGSKGISEKARLHDAQVAQIP